MHVVLTCNPFVVSPLRPASHHSWGLLWTLAGCVNEGAVLPAPDIVTDLTSLFLQAKQEPFYQHGICLFIP